jgi:hypothetical protein
LRNLSHHELLRTTDEPYDLRESHNSALSQRQQSHLPTTQPRSIPRPSSSSGSGRTLRRTPRLERRQLNRVSPLAAGSRRSLTPPNLQRRSVSDQGDGSTTPRATRRNSAQSEYWPLRSTRISKRTASAILYALEEAIRQPFAFTPDYVEENASMSDLLAAGNSAMSTNGRAQNGGSRAASGPVPVPQPQYRGSGVRTPTDIMRQRAEREARKKAESESRQRARNEESRKTQEDGATGTRRRGDAAGVAAGDPGGTTRRSGDPTRGSGDPTRRSGDPTRRSGDPTRRSSDVPTNRRDGDRRSGDPTSGGEPKPVIEQRREYKTAQTSNEPSDAANVTKVPEATRQRGTSVSQLQPRPVQQDRIAPAAMPSTQQRQPQPRQPPAAAPNFQPPMNPLTTANPPQQSQAAQDNTPGAQQRGTTSSFPHAFERWETLSSHWEGLTSYWIRRLQNNSDEMNREPLNQQMARQVTDLSAAGANLFHAVVELQRLRASSERKFQRWFFDTRAEQERARELQGRLENEVRTERQAHADAVAELNRLKNEKQAAFQDRGASDQMLAELKAKDMEVKEKHRELHISKEEARRAWEELGHWEDEERDRTKSLRNGEPTLVGGVQVVPMGQGAPSRQESTNRPSTRDGPLPLAPTAGSARSGQPSVESPLDEPGYTNYDPARSETDTDPYTENGRVATNQAGYAPLPPTTSQPQQQTSNGSGAASQAARAAYSAPQATAGSSAPGGTYLRYGPGGTTAQPGTSSFYQHEGSSLQPEGEQAPVTEPDDRSFVPSNEDTFSEEEFDYDGNGNVRMDAQGRPLFYARGIGSEVSSDENDVQEALDRERMYGERYGSGISGVEYGSGSTSSASTAIPRLQPGARNAPQIQSGPAHQEGQAAPVDYSGSTYGGGPGWEAVPRHHHPTRLSDVLEEDERSRASPSRASQSSRGIR